MTLWRKGSCKKKKEKVFSVQSVVFSLFQKINRFLRICSILGWPGATNVLNYLCEKENGTITTLPFIAYNQSKSKSFTPFKNIFKKWLYFFPPRQWKGVKRFCGVPLTTVVAFLSTGQFFFFLPRGSCYERRPCWKTSVGCAFPSAIELLRYLWETGGGPL